MARHITNGDFCHTKHPLNGLCACPANRRIGRRWAISFGQIVCTLNSRPHAYLVQPGSPHQLGAPRVGCYNAACEVTVPRQAWPAFARMKRKYGYDRRHAATLAGTFRTARGVRNFAIPKCELFWQRRVAG